MLLVYNIGNTVIRIGFTDNGILKDTLTVSNDSLRTADEYTCLLKSLFDLRGISSEDIDGALGSSVVPEMTDTIRTAFERLLGFRPHILGVGTKTGLNILTDDPTQLGSDLVAAAVGALTKYTPPMILVDFGTATTFSVIDKSGAFVGCAIAPGVMLSSEALSSNASLLPHFERSLPKKCIGTNTIESMKSGCIYGNAAMVDGMIRRIENELGYSTNAVASGADAAYIIKHCEHRIAFDDSILLLGLSKIYEKNRRKNQ